jgi:predicted phosphoribosyltransferase
VNESIARFAGADEGYIEQEKRRQLDEIERKVSLYRSVVEKVSLEGKVVVATDDGVATGATMQAALWAIRHERPEKVVLALPVGPPDAVRRLSEDADETVCLRTPEYFEALGRFYVEFGQVEDDELVAILEQEKERRNAK